MSEPAPMLMSEPAPMLMAELSAFHTRHGHSHVAAAMVLPVGLNAYRRLVVHRWLSRGYGDEMISFSVNTADGKEEDRRLVIVTNTDKMSEVQSQFVTNVRMKHKEKAEHEEAFGRDERGSKVHCPDESLHPAYKMGVHVKQPVAVEEKSNEDDVSLNSVCDLFEVEHCTRALAELLLPPHLLCRVFEIHDFPASFKSEHIRQRLPNLKHELLWVDDNHAVVVFDNPRDATEAQIQSTLMQRSPAENSNEDVHSAKASLCLRSLSLATISSVQRVEREARLRDWMLPPKPRPAINTDVAKRMLRTALGRPRTSAVNNKRDEESKH